MTTTSVRTPIDMPAAALAQLIAAGDLSSVEVVAAHIAQIEAVNPALNAVVVKRFTEARAEAQAADLRRSRGEPLGLPHGVPVTVKEAIDLAGTPSTAGLASRATALAPADNPFVARLRAAGAIVLGKANVAQLENSDVHDQWLLSTHASTYVECYSVNSRQKKDPSRLHWGQPAAPEELHLGGPLVKHACEALGCVDTVDGDRVIALPMTASAAATLGVRASTLPWAFAASR